MSTAAPPNAPTLPLPERARLTYRFDRLRALPQGLIEAAGITFLLLIATRAFDADATAKSLIAASGNLGLLLSLWAVPITAHLARPVTHVAASVMIVGGGALFLAAALPSLPMLVMGTLVSMCSANLIIPLVTAAYQSNYPPRERGRYVSRTLVIRIAVSSLAGEGLGRLLETDIGLYRLVLVLFGAACWASAGFLYRIPSHPLRAVNDQDATGWAGWMFSAFGALRLVRRDRLLRWMLLSWMLMGFANLMMFPLRVEYLANPRYGLSLSPREVALYVLVIPGAIRLLLSPMWGALFDRMNFFALRIILNFGFALGIAAFFTGRSALGLLLGAVLFGAANAGGEIAWNLWVTRFAPTDQAAEYMSVHTFLTGVRGVLAPWAGFQLVQHLEIGGVAWMAAGLIVLASLMLVPEMRGHYNRP
ncbi:MAG: MFS transporter [Thermoflexales bacterium]